MKLSIKWLKKHILFKISPELLAHKLTMAGLETENIYKKNGDAILELEVTPNRADCLNMIGMVREISAILNLDRKVEKIQKTKVPSKQTNVVVENKDVCRRYFGVVINDVIVKEGSKDIKDKLASVDMRAVNNIVDITNFCLMETGQPMHAFDLDKIEGKRVVVRRAKKGEKIVTLDGVERALDESVLIVADNIKPIAIAGIMGGKNTEVTRDTKNILVESAYFDPVLIRRTARKLGLSSDSSYRFERGVDFEMVEQAMWLAVSMILKDAKGKIFSFKEVKGKPIGVKTTQIRSRLTDINNIIGGNISKTQCLNILKRLDFKVSTTKGDGFLITPPLFRKDITDLVDIVEEIARIIGYDNLPMSLPNIKPGQILPLKRAVVLEKIKTILTAQSMNEAITFSLMSEKVVNQTFEDVDKLVKITNPLSLDQEVMRPSMLPSLLNVLQFNVNRFQKNIRLFESGKIYKPNKEKEALGIILFGEKEGDWRSEGKGSMDFYDIKGVVECILDGVGLKERSGIKTQHSFLTKGVQSEIQVGKISMAVVGEVSQEVLRRWGINQDGVYFAEIDLEAVYSQANLVKKFQNIVEYPVMTRDVSLAVAKSVLFTEIQETVFQAGEDIFKEIIFKEEYLGEKIEEGCRGLVFSLIYQSDHRTLTEEEVSAAHQKILTALVKEHNVTIR